MSLDQFIEYLNDDELLEVTPESLRLRRRVLDTRVRGRNAAGTSAPGKLSAPEVPALSFLMRLPPRPGFRIPLGDAVISQEGIDEASCSLCALIEVVPGQPEFVR